MVETTLAIIKPDAVKAGNAGKIIDMIEKAGLTIDAMKMFHLTRDQAALFYASHKGKSFYEPLLDFMSSGPSIVLVLRGENAVETWRTAIGPTDSTRAPEGTVRRLFGTNNRLNAVHGSDSTESAAQETGFFFPAVDMVH